MAYHALESLAVAVIVHFKSSVPLNHESKLRMFLMLCKRHFARELNLKSLAGVIIRVENSGFRSKFLYPEFEGENNYKSPQDQISLTDAGLLVRDVERIINLICNLI